MNLPKLVLNVALIHLMLSHLALAHMNIEQTDTYLEWSGIVSYADQMLTVPFIWTIPQHKILELKMECGGKAASVQPDANIINSHMKATDAGLNVDVFEQLCQVDSHFCRIQKRSLNFMASVASRVIGLVSSGIEVVNLLTTEQSYRIETEYRKNVDVMSSKEVNELPEPTKEGDKSDDSPVTGNIYDTISRLDNKVNGFIKKYDSLYIKYTEISNNIVDLRNEMCATNNETISRILAVEYLAIYWNQYKNILDSALRGEVNHQMLNFEEFKRLVNTVRGIRHNLLDSLNFISMFRTSRYILVKHDPTTPSIHGALVIPLILKSKSIPVYTPLILKTTGKKYYNLPDNIAISHIDRYRVYAVDKECLLINDEYLCLSNMHIQSQPQKDIENFLNNEEHSLSTSVAASTENYIVGTHGLYIKSGIPYTIIKNNDGGILDTENVDNEKNIFIAFQDFDMILIEGDSIIGSYKISTELGQTTSDAMNIIPILADHSGRAVQVKHGSLSKESDSNATDIQSIQELIHTNHNAINDNYDSFKSVTSKVLWMFGIAIAVILVVAAGLSHEVYKRRRLEKSLSSLTILK